VVTGTTHINTAPSSWTPVKPRQRRLIKACRELTALRGGMVKPMQLLICGISDDKSALINTLTGKRPPKPVTKPASANRAAYSLTMTSTSTTRPHLVAAHHRVKVAT
jgi:hypothetical protein